LKIDKYSNCSFYVFQEKMNLSNPRSFLKLPAFSSELNFKACRASHKTTSGWPRLKNWLTTRTAKFVQLLIKFGKAKTFQTCKTRPKIPWTFSFFLSCLYCSLAACRRLNMFLINLLVSVQSCIFCWRRSVLLLRGMTQCNITA